LRPIARATAAAATLLWAACLPLGAWAAPFVPASDAEVVETLPARLDPAARAAREAWRRQPDALPLALQAAQAAIARARRDGDPRELGQAQAALAPWWALPSPPPAVRLLRATVRQSQHDFESALADLEALLADASVPAPVQAQAGLTRASVLRVQGRYREAAAACAGLATPRLAVLGPALRWSAQVCEADVMTLGPAAEAGHARLADLARQAQSERTLAPLRGWVALVQAEAADRRGDPAARGHFLAALQDDADVYTLAAYADWLLQHERAAEVEPLLGGRADADALLLRQAIAWRRLRDGRADAAAARLQARFDAAHQRGDRLHEREEAMFAWQVRGDAAAALPLALANWRKQREPADVRLLWHTALATGDREAAELVRQFQQQTGLRDVRLAEPTGPTRVAGRQ
ncbi:MAG TPA: hypothetical protein VFL86_18180, partial [Burkholderiaceae bacterium]|nr:hypothetical protein [Burkholderiaceae bacterium]